MSAVRCVSDRHMTQFCRDRRSYNFLSQRVAIKSLDKDLYQIPKRCSVSSRAVSIFSSPEISLLPLLKLAVVRRTAPFCTSTSGEKHGRASHRERGCQYV